ncbi:hypothetical protein FSP39_002980 [Pinctada imbricata]|uniref:Uncharacterized protein n=1 Tax=Pinctada imbricata TaxID=66713 RepID=A0AA88XMB2_PINIB|nr:hypothetical protein FSP39_002980 [Pinctada imbricata]
MATAMPSEDDIEEKSSTKSTRYVCPICLESLKTPRSLPCLHTFCEDCLQTFITAAAGKNIDDVACPVCRKQIMAPEPGLPRDKWAKAFPLNYYLSTYLVQQDASDLKSEIENCKACKRSSNLLTPADHYCKNCGETICDACKQLHKNFQIMSNHVIVTLEHFRNNPSIPEKDEICPYHPGKVIEVYCLDHSKMCCSVCFATNHRHCKDVKSIEECAEDLSEDVLKLISTKLESLLESVEGEIKEKENIGEKRKKCKEEVVAKMTHCIEAAKKNLDILLQQFESDMDRKDSSAESQLLNILKILQGIKTSVIGDRQMLESAIKYGSKIQLFFALEKAKIQMGDRMKQISDVASGSLTVNYTVVMKKVEEVCKWKSIGSVDTVASSGPAVTKGTLVLMGSFKKDSDYLRRQLHFIHLEPHMMKWVEKWTCKLPTGCYGATVFGTEIAVVTRNIKIVMFNRDGGVLCEHTIPYDKEPADINNTGDENKFFISFRNEKILKEYHIDNAKITELNQISLQGVAEGFCIFDNQIVHASNKCIYI